MSTLRRQLGQLLRSSQNKFRGPNVYALKLSDGWDLFGRDTLGWTHICWVADRDELTEKMAVWSLKVGDGKTYVPELRGERVSPVEPIEIDIHDGIEGEIEHGI